MWGLVDYTKFKVGALWGGQAVQISTKGIYRGVVYLYNDPGDYVDPSTGLVGYPRAALPANWKMVALPPDPSENELYSPNPWNPFPVIVGWNTFDWPEDAKYQWAIAHMAAGYVSQYKANNFYTAPPGAPYVPMYAHLGR